MKHWFHCNPTIIMRVEFKLLVLENAMYCMRLALDEKNRVAVVCY